MAQIEIPSPARLVELIMRDDPSAKLILVREYGRGVRSILRRWRVLDRDMDDLAQEVWATALAKVRAGDLRDPDKLDSFITGIARGLAVNLRRKTDRQRTDVDTDKVENSEAVGESPERLTRIAQYADHVVSVLRSMKRSRDREVLIRIWLEGASSEEVSESLGISRERLHGIVSRARQRFLALLRTTDAGREMERDHE